MKKQRVICAMSGGVDSSVAAAILKKQGYDVIGIFMKFWTEKTSAIPGMAVNRLSENICCSAEAATAARAVASCLKIPFYVINLEKEFKKAVVDYYIKEYEAGRTPNPCVVCNRDIKGEVLMRKALSLKADYLATGHYARIVSDSGISKSEFLISKQIPNSKFQISNYYLLQAKDKTKDQTYFLWMLTQKHLEKMLFPIGNYTKAEVRKLAKKWGLPNAERRESQGICFIPDRDVSGFLHRHAKKLTKAGDILDINGKKLGVHNGLINYTVGQRERLGLGGPKAYYVVELKCKTNTLVVGAEHDLYRNTLIVRNLNWLNSPFAYRISHTRIQAKIRYGHPAEECQLENVGKDKLLRSKLRSIPDGASLFPNRLHPRSKSSTVRLRPNRLRGIQPLENKIKVIFQKPQRAITPGQSIVFYLSRAKSRDRNEEVLGGGVIERNPKF